MTPLFILGLSLLLAHELDAVAAREWRMFPLLSRLDDNLAQQLFVLGHVPIFAILLWGLSGPGRPAWVHGIDLFLVVHVGLHVLLRNHPENRFGTRALSWCLIAGAGLAGVMDLLL